MNPACNQCGRAQDEYEQIAAERAATQRELADLQGWLLGVVGSASSVRQAKRVVERCIAAAIAERPTSAAPEHGELQR